VFTTLIVQPIFNLLVLIYALLPGHNFGVAIIIFTIVIRLLMWPLVRKQLRNAKLMRELQPELKRIKKESKGDRQKESMLIMDLYKERGVSPFGSIFILLLQLPILIGLYAGLRRIIDDPYQIVSFAYPFLQNLSWMKELASDISKFDATLFGFIDLAKPALGPNGVYWPAMMIVLASAITQYFQGKQLMPTDSGDRKLRQILKDASSGKETDQAEVNAAVGRITLFFMPVMIFFFTVNIASALSLYWFVSGLIALIQQARVFKEDEVEMATKLHKDDKKDTKNSPTSGRKKVKSTARVVSISSEKPNEEANTASKTPKNKNPPLKNLKRGGNNNGRIDFVCQKVLRGCTIIFWPEHRRLCHERRRCNRAINTLNSS
jgi:YidC/Oxa1 family membrane protein insertase